jgi:hypothetical protein
MDLKEVEFENIYYIHLKSPASWNIKSSSPVKVNRRFGEKYRLHFQVQRVSRVRNQHEVDSKQILLVHDKD